MKLVFLSVSLIVAFTVDCRSQPGPDSQNSIIAEETPFPDFTLEPGDQKEISLEETTSEEITSTINEHDWSYPEEESRQSDGEFRGSGCKAKSPCAFHYGSCIANTTDCRGKLLPGGCKGSNCHCCIPVCPEGFFMVPSNSSQCFKLFMDQKRNWTQSYSKCRQEGLRLPRIYNAYSAIDLRNYIMQRFGNTRRETWLGARGTGSSIKWVRDGVVISNSSSLWYQSPSTTTNYCVDLRNEMYYRSRAPARPFYTDPCSHNHHYAMCELVY